LRKDREKALFFDESTIVHERAGAKGKSKGAARLTGARKTVTAKAVPSSGRNGFGVPEFSRQRLTAVLRAAH